MRASLRVCAAAAAAAIAVGCSQGSACDDHCRYANVAPPAYACCGPPVYRYYAPTAYEYYVPINVYRGSPRAYGADYYTAPVVYGVPWRRRVYGHDAAPRLYLRPRPGLRRWKRR